jgi:hypothetical protein
MPGAPAPTSPLSLDGGRVPAGMVGPMTSIRREKAILWGSFARNPRAACVRSVRIVLQGLGTILRAWEGGTMLTKGPIPAFS